MTPNETPNEADAKDVAEKMLRILTPEYKDSINEFEVGHIRQVCTRLLELEKHKLHYDRLFTDGVLIPSEEYAAQVKEREALKAELKAANARCDESRNSGIDDAIEIVQQARSGEIDCDLRCVIYHIQALRSPQVENE